MRSVSPPILGLPSRALPSALILEFPIQSVVPARAPLHLPLLPQFPSGRRTPLLTAPCRLPGNSPPQKFRTARAACQEPAYRSYTATSETIESHEGQKPLYDLEVARVANSYRQPNYSITKFPNYSIFLLTPLLLPPRPPFHTGTACLPNDLQTLYGIFSQKRSSASPPHRPADKMSAPACFPPGTACCRCLSLRRRLSEPAAEFSSANPCLHDRECTIRNSRADKSSWSAKRTSQYTARRRPPPRRPNPAWNPLWRANRNPC